MLRITTAQHQTQTGTQMQAAPGYQMSTDPMTGYTGVKPNPQQRSNNSLPQNQGDDWYFVKIDGKVEGPKPWNQIAFFIQFAQQRGAKVVMIQQYDSNTGEKGVWYQSVLGDNGYSWFPTNER